MKIKIFFLISAMNALSYLCFGNCCENCCGDCWNNCGGKENEKKNEDEKNKEKGKTEEQIFLEEEKGQEEEAKKFVNKDWFENKKPNLKLYKRTESGGDEKIKVTKYTNGKINVENFNPETDTHKWALFEIKYKEEVQGEKTVYLYCSDIESEGVGGIFRDKDILLDISVLACDTSEVKSMSCMFWNCIYLKNINFTKNFNTSKVTGMLAMFSRCANLKTLDLSIFNTKEVKDIKLMFAGCNELKTIKINANDDISLQDGIEKILKNYKKEEGKNYIIYTKKEKGQEK